MPLSDLWRIPLEPPPAFPALRRSSIPSWKSFSPTDLWRIPLEPPPTPSDFVALRGNLFAFSWKSFLPLATFGGSLSSLLQPLSGPSPFFVALRGNLFPFSWKSFLPFPTFGGSLSSLLQPLRGPSPFFVALRGNLFPFSWKSFLPFLADPSRASSNAFVALPVLRKSPFSWKSFLPFPTFGGSLLSPLQPLSGPSPFFVALRGNLFPFSWKSFLPWPTFGGSLSSLLQPLRGPSPSFVALRGNLFPFSWKSYSPFPTFGGSLSSLLQRLSGPSPSFVALRGYLFPFSWKSFLPFPTFGGSLSSLLQRLSGPSPCPFVDNFVAPSWKSFSLFFVALHGPLSSPNPLESLRPPARPLADPSRAFSNPFVALRRSSWPFVEIFLPFPGNPFSPCPTFGGSLSSLLQPLSGPSWKFVPLRGYLFPSWSFVDPLRGFLFFVVSIRGSSCPFVDPFVDNRDNVPSLQAAPGTFPHLC